MPARTKMCLGTHAQVPVYSGGLVMSPHLVVLVNSTILVVVLFFAYTPPLHWHCVILPDISLLLLFVKVVVVISSPSMLPFIQRDSWALIYYRSGYLPIHFPPNQLILSNVNIWNVNLIPLKCPYVLAGHASGCWHSVLSKQIISRRHNTGQ